MLIAGLAAFAYYKYSKLSEEQKRNLVGDLKEKGKKLYDQYAPEEIKNMFGKTETGTTDRFDEDPAYTG